MADMVVDNTPFVLGDVQVTPKGSKRCTLATSDGKDVTFTSEQLVLTPFGPSSFDKDPNAVRMSLDLRTAEGEGTLEQFFGDLDAWAVQYLTEHSDRIFKRVMTREQVIATPSIKQKASFQPLVRAKMDTTGRRAACFWTPENVARDPPADWKSTLFRLNVHVSNLWIMGASFGLVCNVTDLQIVREGVEYGVQRTSPFPATT